MPVEFENEQFSRRSVEGGNQGAPGPVARIVIRLGLAKDQRGAHLVLAIVAFLCFALSVFVAARSLFSDERPEINIQDLPPAFRQKLENSR
jgi:hypothetical protein